MKDQNKILDIVLKVVSYILAATVGASLTLVLLVQFGYVSRDGGMTKLEQLQLLIEERFIGEADATAMGDAAAEGMIASLGDTWSYYISADQYQSFVEQMENAYVGVGITVTHREDGTGIDILQVTAGGPAEEAGLLPGDVIVAVNGEAIVSDNLQDLSSRVKGEEGTTVELSILRGETVYPNQCVVLLDEALTDAEAKSVGTKLNMFENVVSSYFVEEEDGRYFRVTVDDNLLLGEVVEKIETLDGVETVDFEYENEQKQLDVLVERRRILIPVVKGDLLADGKGLVTIYNFDDRCASETIATIEELLSSGARTLIFDVRNNPGGYKHELVELLDYLLPEGVLFRSERYDGEVINDYSDARRLEVPMVVLVNSESYSAAEFFAAALREYNVALIVGEETCGKGYFQQTYTLLDGSAVNLSVGKYYTPNGASLANVGITPDVVVPVDDETFNAIYSGTLPPEEDPQIQEAVKLLTGW